MAEGERDLGGDEELVTRAGATLENVHQTLSRCHPPLQARHLNPAVYAQKHPWQAGIVTATPILQMRSRSSALEELTQGHKDRK